MLAVTCIGARFSGMGCSIFEIDLVKQPFCVRTIFFDVLFRYAFLLKFTLVDSLLFYTSCRIYFLYIGFLDCLSLEIDFGILGSSKKNISCIAPLCCLFFIMQLETWCSVVLCILYSRSCMFYVALCLYHANKLILLLYTYGSIWVQEQIKTKFGLCCYSTWFGHVGFADGTCLLVPSILGMTVRYTCGAGVLSLAGGCMR